MNQANFPQAVPVPEVVDDSRLLNRKIVPTAIETSVLGNIIEGNPVSSALGSGLTATFSLSNATRFTVRVFLDTLFKGNTLLAVPDWAVYFTSQTEATQWPNATQHMGNFPISFYNDWGRTNNIDVVNCLTMYNNTGSTVSVIVRYRARIIVNPTGGGENANV